MSSKAIDYRIILKRDGQTQQQRMPQWLDPALVPLDGRTKADFLDYLKAVAKEIKFYDLRSADNAIVEDGDWSDFFQPDATELNKLAQQASLPAHLALWNTFIELYEASRRQMNLLGQRHLDFYYNEVLSLAKKNPVADKAHILFEPKKNTAPTLLTTGTSLLAGKDRTKRELHYRLQHDIIVNSAGVAQLRSVYVNPSNKNFIHAAPVANSTDGLGEPLDKLNPKWAGFGHARLSLASIGFCLAAPVLKMKEGDRTVVVKLTLRNLPVSAKNNALLLQLFSVSITGEKGWVGPKNVSPAITSGDNKNFEAQFSFRLSKDEPPVVAYNAELHGGNVDTTHPVIQVLLNNSKADFGYKDLSNAEIVNATIEVTVTGMSDLQAENDFGTLNVKKSFTPFGATPEANANFFISNEEVFSKRLKEFYVDVEWKNIPAAQLDGYFSGYDGPKANADFTALPAFKDGFSWEERSAAIPLFNSSNAQANSRWKFTNPAFALRMPVLHLPDITVKASAGIGLSLQQKISGKMSHLLPAFAALQVKPLAATKILYKPVLQAMVNAYKDVRKGMFSLRLKRGFFFKEYPRKYTEEILAATSAGTPPKLPAEPFAPEIQSISLNYTATTSRTSLEGNGLSDFVEEEIEFFHYGAFGQMREHAFARSQAPFLNNSIVKLFPEYTHEGELFIGFSELNAEDSACVLFQLAAGSANPEKSKATISWSVLCDNYWKPLTNEDLVFDTTEGLLTSGVIKFVIPSEATTSNTIMPAGLLWLKASITKDTDAVCELVDVLANAAIAVFDNQDNDTGHFAAALPAGTINKLEKGNASIKSVKQPYASFDGQAAETSPVFYTRVSERLRHKERSISLWDYERLILQHFPQVHKVKCINHATMNAFYTPGEVLIILVPDLTNQNAVNPFQPKVDKYILEEVSSFLQKHSSSWVRIHVSNPFFEPVRISVKIKLKKGFEFNYYQQLINQQLQEFLSPWIANKGSDIYFGGKITKSMIVQFLENLEFVDFITDLRLFHSLDGGHSFSSNVEVAEASGPAAILVSDHQHEIFKF